MSDPQDSVRGGSEPETMVPSGYVPPRLTKVGNVRELLAGEGGTVTDADPSAIAQQQG